MGGLVGWCAAGVGVVVVGGGSGGALAIAVVPVVAFAVVFAVAIAVAVAAPAAPAVDASVVCLQCCRCYHCSIILISLKAATCTACDMSFRTEAFVQNSKLGDGLDVPNAQTCTAAGRSIEIRFNKSEHNGTYLHFWVKTDSCGFYHRLTMSITMRLCSCHLTTQIV